MIEAPRWTDLGTAVAGVVGPRNTQTTGAASGRLANLLAECAKTLDVADRRYSLQLSQLKSRIARHVRAERARAMLNAAGAAQGQTPAWMLSARVPLAAWIEWTKCLRQVVESAQSSQDDALPTGRFEIHSTAGTRPMTLRGGIYAGTLSGVIDISVQAICRYVDEPRPRFVIQRSALPETVLASIGEPEDRSNRGRRLSDLIDHPFTAAYDPPITRVVNVNGAVEIALESGYTTLAPVPVAAMRMVPADADPGRPWELSRRELEVLRTWSPAALTPP